MQGKAQDRRIEKELEDKAKQQKGKDELASQEMDKKKQYIKQHILQEYDGDEEILELFAQHFLQYLEQRKGIKTEEHNLDLLTIQELTEIVTNFHQEHPKPHKQQPSNEPAVLLNEDLIGFRSRREAWNPKKVIYSNGAWDYELNGYEQCTREKTFFCEDYNHKEIVIIFSSNHTKKRGGFFGIGGTLELWIELKSNVFKETVERTVEDFIFLRKALRKLFPFTFVPPLNITDKDLSRIDNEYVRICIMNECRKFINTICQDKQLFENIYTFRFFKEFKYENYIEHKKRLNEIFINHVKLLRNPEGCVPIQISDLNQALIKDYSKKSELLEKMWSNVEGSNSRIIQKIKQIKQQIGYQTKQFQLVLKEIGNSNHTLHSECYEKLTEILLCYEDVYKVYNQNLHQYQELFESVNLKLTNQAQSNWKAFINYKSEVNEFSQEYQLKRKVFLEKELNQEKAERYSKSTIPNEKNKVEPKEDNHPAMSVIVQLGLQSDGERELAWIERYSKWQAYINKQFTLSFEKLVDNDRDILTKILQEKTQKVLESNKREEESFIGLLSIIHE